MAVEVEVEVLSASLRRGIFTIHGRKERRKVLGDLPITRSLAPSITSPHFKDCKKCPTNGKPIPVP